MDDWHLDRRVPIVFILAILAQSAGLVWYLSKQDSRLASLEIKSIQLEAAIQLTHISVDTNRLNVAVINQSLDDIKRSLIRIEKNVTKNND